MARIMRMALTLTSGISWVFAGATAAHAEERTSAASGEATVQLQVTHSGKCLDIDHAKTDNGIKAQQWTCNGTVAQQWRMVPVDNSSFELRSIASGKCLEVENSGTQEGADVQQWRCSGGKQMRWRTVLVDAGRDLFEIRPTHTDNRCLDIDRAMMENGVRAQQWGCNQSEAQLWQITPVK
ncbi:RICIN domain-containing protein [Streptomyces ehimensis]|uniref:RICIN domain-containing protein n=1 Tax=Streptomyces ehimensis TaxID=68195 RepID=A0ABV9BU85_9ACTN